MENCLLILTAWSFNQIYFIQVSIAWKNSIIIICFYCLLWYCQKQPFTYVLQNRYPWKQVFSCKIRGIFKNTLFWRTPPACASLLLPLLNLMRNQYRYEWRVIFSKKFHYTANLKFIGTVWTRYYIGFGVDVFLSFI